MEQTKKGVWVDKKGEKERKMDEGKNRGGERERERERERKGREKKMEIFPAFRQSKLNGLRRKVNPRIAGYTWIPKS